MRQKLPPGARHAAAWHVLRRDNEMDADAHRVQRALLLPRRDRQPVVARIIDRLAQLFRRT